jgi:hypothetical protein
MAKSNLKIEYLKEYAIGNTFIETGTYLGHTVELAKEFGFNFVHSIEIDENLYDLNKKKFESDKSIKIWQGDSIFVLDQIMKEINEPSTFWLDAHASGPLLGNSNFPCPLKLELNKIFCKKINTHTIFIDDCRLFESHEWGFVKKEDVVSIIKEANPNYNLYYLDGHIKEDILCACIK